MCKCLTPNVIGKVLSLGKLGMRYNAIRKVAENIEKGIKFTEKSRLGILFYTVSNEYTFNEPKMKVYQKKKYSFSTVKEYQDIDGWYHLSTCSDFFNDIKTDWHNNMSLGLFKNNSDKKQDALYPTQKPKELISRFVLALVSFQ